MKKYIDFLCMVLLLSGVSCADSRYDYMVDDSVYLPKSEWQQQTLIVMNSSDYVYPVWVHKGGYYQDEFAGRLVPDADYLNRYNTQHATDYTMLDDSYYSLESNFTIAGGEDEAAVPLTLKTELILQEKGYGTYYLPFTVQSSTDAGKVNTEKNSFLLAFTLQQPVLTIDGENKGDVILDLSEETVDTYDVDITAVLDIASPEELTVDYSEDASLLVAGEKRLDARYFSYDASAVMPAGEKYAENFLTLKLSELPRGRWVVPMRLSTKNEKVKVAAGAYLKLTVVKGTLDDIQWTGDYLQGNKMIVSSGVLDETWIGHAPGVDVEIRVDQDWLAVTGKDGDIYLEIKEANPGNQERVATVTVLDKGTLLEKKIEVRQCINGYGIVLNKDSWSIAAYSDNTSDKKSQFNRLFDNFWPVSTVGNTNYIELNNRQNGSDPFVLTFDLGENPHSYNSFGLMPRLQWTQPAPKTVKIEVSDNLNDWTVLGPDANGSGKWDAFSKEELFGNNSWNNHYEGIVHWFEFDRISKRYIRLSMYEGWYQDSGKVICLEEVFVADRENP